MLNLSITNAHLIEKHVCRMPLTKYEFFYLFKKIGERPNMIPLEIKDFHCNCQLFVIELYESHLANMLSSYSL